MGNTSAVLSCKCNLGREKEERGKEGRERERERKEEHEEATLLQHDV